MGLTGLISAVFVELHDKDRAIDIFAGAETYHQ